jgi:hypothetical protein
MDTAWFKSSYSDNGGDCIEVSPSCPTTVPVRDSKDPAGPALTFPAEGFASFAQAVKSGALGVL